MNQDTNYIPVSKASSFNGNNCNFFENEYIDDDDEMVPPHMIIRQRISRRIIMTYLVCICYGETLKRRNLSEGTQF
ncbi:hypothetical protein R3W88_031951 [Solanum pinnatisectum]|uniref:Uncharacterized protein n=1 Tax=Solanum pinnatisectum TaxID=50273 RepID=A0AAV9LPQ9_9SOLN|nr:hypothetical protein R3W88_031951 [Solanum pinnatisectum]